MPALNADLDDIRSRLAAIIKDRALACGDFKLASGQRSSYFIDSNSRN